MEVQVVGVCGFQIFLAGNWRRTREGEQASADKFSQASDWAGTGAGRQVEYRPGLGCVHRPMRKLKAFLTCDSLEVSTCKNMEYTLYRHRQSGLSCTVFHLAHILDGSISRPLLALDLPIAFLPRWWHTK